MVNEEDEALHSACLGEVEAKICLPITSDLIHHFKQSLQVLFLSLVLTYFLLFGNPCVCLCVYKILTSFQGV